MRRHRLASALLAVVPAGALLVSAGPAHAAGTNPWSPTGGATPGLSTITGGPWTLNQAKATYANPLGDPASPARYCLNPTTSPTDMNGTINEHLNPNGTATPTPTDLMSPFYFPLIASNDGRGNLTGLFDWRPKDNNEAVTEAVSHDNGKTWTSVSSTAGSTDVLRYRSTCYATPNSDDNGQGHANNIKIGKRNYLYTFDRGANADSAGLLIHKVGSFGDVTNLPHDERLGGQTYGNDTTIGAQSDDPLTPSADPALLKSGGVTTRTSGLINPDGILGVVPGSKTGSLLPDGTTLPGGAVEVAYLEKDLNYFAGNDTANACTKANTDARTQKKPNEDRTLLRIAYTVNGVNFKDAGAINFTNELSANTTSATATRFIGVDGTVLQYTDGTYGLFFSGGNCSDGDSDAYGYIGYAHSNGATPNSFTIDNGYSNAFAGLHTDYSFPQGGTRSYYTGRTYAPQVVASADGRSAQLLFSGYQYDKPTTDLSTTEPKTGAAQYRNILYVPLTATDASVNTAGQANSNPSLSTPPPATPEVPTAVLLPLGAATLLGGVVVMRRRRSSSPEA